MKTLKERIEIETAGLNGEVIERRFLQGINSDYEIKPDADHDDAVYCWPDFDYRIKPEPRVIYVNEYKTSGISSTWHTTRETAIKSSAGVGRTITRVIKFIEVLEE